MKTLRTLFKQDKEAFVVPKGIQDVIPVTRIWQDGIFQVGKNKYSKCYRFTDINYAVASRADKEGMFLEYSELLNSFDTGATTKITILNRRLNKIDFEKNILLPLSNDKLDEYRKEYNKMLLDKATGANGITQEKFITVSVNKKSVEEARNYLEAIEIVEYFNNKNVPIWVAHYKRTLPKFLKIRELLQKDIIGKIVNINFNSERQYNSLLNNHKWLYNIELSVGGRFFDIAPHFVDLLVFYFGKLKKVYGLSSNNCDKYKTEDIVTFIFETESGIIGSANYNFLSNKRLDVFTISGTKGAMSFSLEGGGDIKLNILGKEYVITFDEPYIYEKDMVDSIGKELLTKKYNSNICHGKDALETYNVIDLVLSDFYNGRNREFWKNQ